MLLLCAYGDFGGHPQRRRNSRLVSVPKPGKRARNRSQRLLHHDSNLTPSNCMPKRKQPPPQSLPGGSESGNEERTVQKPTDTQRQNQSKSRSTVYVDWSTLYGLRSLQFVPTRIRYKSNAVCVVSSSSQKKLFLSREITTHYKSAHKETHQRHFVHERAECHG